MPLLDFMLSSFQYDVRAPVETSEPVNEAIENVWCEDRIKKDRKRFKAEIDCDAKDALTWLRYKRKMGQLETILERKKHELKEKREQTQVGLVKKKVALGLDPQLHGEEMGMNVFDTRDTRSTRGSVSVREKGRRIIVIEDIEDDEGSLAGLEPVDEVYEDDRTMMTRSSTNVASSQSSPQLSFDLVSEPEGQLLKDVLGSV